MPELAPEWVAQYIGIPFVDKGRDKSGLDCWGIVRMVLWEQYGVPSPDYQNYRKIETPADIPSVAKLLHNESRNGSWTRIEAGEEQAGDVVLCREGGELRHVGIVVVPGLMLHSIDPVGSCLDGYRRPHRRNAVEGFYRPVAGG